MRIKLVMAFIAIFASRLLVNIAWIHMLQLTLQTLIKKLSKVSPEKPIYFENVFSGGGGYNEIAVVKIDEWEIDPHRAGVGHFQSWRGNYAEFSLEPTHAVRNAGAVLRELRNSIGKTFQGYKGDDFVAHAHVSMWCASYGHSGAWARTHAIFDDAEANEPIYVHLSLCDVVERKDEVVILYDERGES